MAGIAWDVPLNQQELTPRELIQQLNELGRLPAAAIAATGGLPLDSKWAKLLDSRKPSWPMLAGLPAIMASPPTVTLSSSGAATSIGGSAERSIVQGSFPNATYKPGVVTIAGGPAKITQGTLGTGVMGQSWTEEGASYGYYGITTDAPKLEFVISGGGRSYRIWVNGQVATANEVAGPPSDGALYRIIVDFGGVRAFREIRLETLGNLRGVQLLPTDTMTPSPKSGPRVIMLGDSFGEGTGATDHSTGFAPLLAQMTGWDIWPLAEGATGYLQPNPASARTNVMGHIADVVNNAPDMVLWALGINDYNTFTPVALQAQAQAAYGTIAAALPGVPQVVLSPFAGTGNVYLSAAWIAGRDALKAAANTFSLPFADPVGTGYLIGTGKVGGAIGDGNADLLVSSDSTHPSPAGHAALAWVIAITMAAAIGG